MFALEYWIIRMDAVPLSNAYSGVYTERYAEIWRFSKGFKNFPSRALSIPIILNLLLWWTDEGCYGRTDKVSCRHCFSVFHQQHQYIYFIFDIKRPR